MIHISIKIQSVKKHKKLNQVYFPPLAFIFQALSLINILYTIEIIYAQECPYIYTYLSLFLFL